MKLIIPCKDVVHVIRQEDILCCKVESSYTTIFLLNGEEIIISKSLSKVSEQLNPERFLRISQSCLVNIEHVNKIDKRNKIVELFGSERIRFTVKIQTLIASLEKVNDIGLSYNMDQNLDNQK